MRVFISMGSNLGDRVANCREAVRRLAGYDGVRVVKTSSLYETEPWGVTDQGPFINAVVEIDTGLAPEPLFELLKSIEAEMGRTKGRRWGPRLIDLDLIFYGDRVVDTERLKVPHPSVEERAFVLVPLSELAPGFTHPASGRPVSEILSGLPESEKSGVKKLTEKI
ncbi:MAG TPA: 2-amino-4-hydroxy-6-hydroxymethyldihydropteridine diphosphokinase [Thermodesulfobacteriota bacterium]|nr:2-amino-4-hydroxy-6-hydroxymethyldihydropteridine diphosphokinase [Thermodesulfobacteriota bacterium]